MGSFLGKLFINPEQLPEGGYGLFQLLFLMFIYGCALSWGSNLIADGSELLLLIPALAGIVGSVVLPVLGAVPDGAIVLFSGLGPNAQEQVAVGVGALAGSTIMLMTVPWLLAVVAGRVDIVDGRPQYKPANDAPKSTVSVCAINKSGVEVKSIIGFNAKLLVLTSLPYFLIQGSAFVELCATTSDDLFCNSRGEALWALLGLIYCVVAFAAYLAYQVYQSNSEANEERRDRARERYIESGLVTAVDAYKNCVAVPDTHPGESTTLVSRAKIDRLFDATLRRFFRKYDADANGMIGPREVHLLLRDLGAVQTPAAADKLLKLFDLDENESIDWSEFRDGMNKFAAGEFDEELRDFRHQNQESSKARKLRSQGSYLRKLERGGQSAVSLNPEDPDSDESEEEEEEIPEDLLSLEPAVRMRKIKIRSAMMMLSGTVLVLLFSDPMVDCMSELGGRIGVGPFYVSFILAPLASNASELVASYNYAKKKTRRTMTISLSALLGAGCMNNTFCLGIFLALVYFRGLAWKFTAETVAILVVEAIVALVALKSIQRVRDALLVSLLFPLSLVLVAVLERVGLN